MKLRKPGESDLAKRRSRRTVPHPPPWCTPPPPWCSRGRGRGYGWHTCLTPRKKAKGDQDGKDLLTRDPIGGCPVNLEGHHHGQRPVGGRYLPFKDAIGVEKTCLGAPFRL